MPSVDQERLHFVLEGSDDAYWDWNIGTGRCDVNRRWLQMRGLPLDQSTAISVDDWKAGVHPDDLPAALQALDLHLRGAAEGYRVEYRVGNAQHGYHWVQDRGRVVARDAHGRPTRMCGVNTDVETQRRITSELAGSHRMLTAVQALQREFIRTKDLRQQAERMLSLALETSSAGYGFIAEVRQDEAGNPYLKTHAMTNIAWDAATQALYQEHLSKGLEFRNLKTLFGYTLRTGELLVSNNPRQHPERSGTPHGHPPMNSYIGIPIESGGRMVGMLAMANRPGGFDASLARELEPLLSTFAVMLEAQTAERHRAEAIEQAQQAELRLRRITDGVPGVVFQCRSAGGAAPSVGFVSDGASKLVGIDAHELARHPRRLLRLVDPLDRRVLLQMVAVSVRNGLPWGLEFRLRRPDGSLRWLRAAAQCLHGAEAEYEWNGMLYDVSDQKRVEQALREAKDAADTASRAKSSFLATMSHEIRTPMHAMLGFLELLSHSRLSAEQAEKIKIVEDAGQSLLGLIDDILDFSRIEAGRMELHPTVVELEPLVRHKQQIWAEVAARKGLGFSVEIAAEACNSYLLDDLRLRQVLRNLLSNAIKFTESGHVHLSVCVDAAAGKAPDLVFRVRDTGIGISREAMERVFKPFEQADSDTTRRFGGSGLGLSISRRLARLMGGTLAMRSEVGQGTEMTLRLPAGRAQGPAVRPAPENLSVPDLRPGLRLLVAEDHAVNRVLLMRQLERLGLQADFARDGQEALERLQQRPYDLLITDCHMPRVDGFELARRARALEREQPGRLPMPIIACTADALPETVATCTEVGMDDFVAKPISLATLSAKLGRYLSAQAAPAPEPAALPCDLLDRGQLHELSGGDAELQQLALTLFVEALPEDLEHLLRAAAEGDDAALRSHCHRLTGLAQTVGAGLLGDYCGQLHALARSGERQGRAELCEALQRCAQQTAAQARQLARA